MKLAVYITIIVIATVSIRGSNTKKRYNCRELCCSDQDRYNNITKRLKATRNHTNISNCIERCLANNNTSGTRNISGTQQYLCNDHNETWTHIQTKITNRTENDMYRTLECKVLLTKERATNDFVSVPEDIRVTFHKEDSGNGYYINITWNPLNITDRSKVWTDYVVMWWNGEMPLRCHLVSKNQTFLVINSTWYEYPDAIEFNVFTYPMKYNQGYTIGKHARPPHISNMVGVAFPTETVPIVTSSLMAAIIVGSCIGIAFVVAVAVAWKLNVRVNSFQDIFTVYWNLIGTSRQQILRTTISEQTIIEERTQVYLSYFHEDNEFMAIVKGLVHILGEEGYDVKINKMFSTEMIEDGPDRWAQKHIANSSKVVVLCSPSYIKICQQGKDAVVNGYPSEERRVWFEIQIISHIYTRYKSASKIVCLWMNQGVPNGLPPWMSVTYTWPHDQEKILRRLRS